MARNKPYCLPDGSWWVDYVQLNNTIIKDIYREFLKSPAEIKTVKDMWEENNNSSISPTIIKNVIFDIADRLPEVDAPLKALYVIYLKYNCLHLLQSVQGITAYTIEEILPLEIRYMIDGEKLAEFYDKYAVKSPNRQFNRIKIPPKKHLSLNPIKV